METLYAVEYRNMRTAVHGLFIYEEMDIACAVDAALSEIDDPIDLSDPVGQEAIRVDDAVDEFDFSEINYRDVEWDDDEGEYIYTGADDDAKVIVMNEEHDVHDIYGL